MATPLLKPAGANEYRKQKKINPTLTPPTPASRLRNVIHPFLMASFSYLRYFFLQSRTLDLDFPLHDAHSEDQPQAAQQHVSLFVFALSGGVLNLRAYLIV